jgi:thymidine phosphorylase
MRYHLVRPGIETSAESVAFLSTDELLCQCLGLHPLDRIEVADGSGSVLAVLNGVTSGLVPPGSVGLSETAFERLALEEGVEVSMRPAGPPASVTAIRHKIAGRPFAGGDLRVLVDDIVSGRHSKVELTALVVASAIHGLSDDEVTELVRAMVARGRRMRWPGPIVADKHCIGGVPGNRTTPIVVAIAVAAGLTIPKTSSRAVTSAAGTADAMETLMNVSLSVERMEAVVRRAGGCLVWGGAMDLAPADDAIIRVEHPLHIDCEGLMLASILAKKIAAGATHVVIDIPVGPGSKVESSERAAALRERFRALGARLDLELSIQLTDGSSPIGHGVGPAIEARDVLAVLDGDALAPRDLREKSIAVAGSLLELVGAAAAGQGALEARSLLDSGAARERFELIRDLQGRSEPPRPGPAVYYWCAPVDGRVVAISNESIARAARLAGAPRDPAAGVDVHTRVGDRVTQGQPLLRVHARNTTMGEYARRYLETEARPMRVEPS